MKLLNTTYFSDLKLFKKIGKVIKSAGIIVIYPALILYYLFKDSKVPKASKTLIAAALAYFIFPADSIPDLTPVIGYSDDLAILYATISNLMKYITPEILAQVKGKIMEWFGEVQIIEAEEQKLLNKMAQSPKKDSNR